MKLLPACLAASLISVCLYSASWAQDVQARGDALLTRARELSGIRTSNAPVFRLTAKFSFVAKDLTEQEGTFVEVWVSDSRWRRETVVNNVHRIEIVGPTRRWLVEGADDFPDRAVRVGADLQIVPPSERKFEFASIDEHKEKDPPYVCALSKRGSRQELSAFCFDKKSGIIVENAFPELRPTKTADPLRAVEHACMFGSFQRFEKFWFPRQVECTEDGHKEITIDVTGLAVENAPDEALFNPPAGAIEYAICHGTFVEPKAISTPEPQLPSLSSTAKRAFVSMMIDVKGHPQNVKVIDSTGDKRSDAIAIDTARAWRFKPATCNGEAVPFPVKLEMDFNFFR